MKIPIIMLSKNLPWLYQLSSLTCLDSTFLILTMIRVVKTNYGVVVDDDIRLNASLLSCLLYFSSKAPPPLV